jgi:serine/threonine protein kinase
MGVKMTTPSEMLMGEVIDGWTVDEPLRTFQGATGGHFSRGYIVSKEGKKAFLKAMDLHCALGKGLKAVEQASRQYNFEKELLYLCRDRRLSHIVRLLADGEHIIQRLPNGGSDLFNRVYYIIFELADGDIRKELVFDGDKGDAWKAYILHQIAVALTQLHKCQIAHQDVKPSNILSFKEARHYKLSDLGRSSSRTIAAPTDSCSFPGDLSYAPPEYLYGYIPSEYNDRRFGSDAYLLGSMISFLYMGVGALVLTVSALEDSYQPHVWAGSYIDVLPFLSSAHTKATIALQSYLPKRYSQEFLDCYFQLCHPDPSERGDPKARSQVGRPIGIDRYVSRFDALAKKMGFINRLRA